MFRKSSTLCKCLILYALASPAGVLAATTVETRIHDVIIPTREGENASVLSTSDGRVYEVDSYQADVMASLLRAQAGHTPLRLTLDGGDRIVAAVELPSESGDDPELDPVIQDSHGLGYRASNLGEMSDADSLFDSLPALKHHSQCFQRAHVWARQMYLRDAVYSMKVFLFFTRAFIQQHHYKWWFHVAPFVYVRGQEIVLDPEFVRQPREMHEWTDFFMMDRGSVKPPLSASPDCSEIASYTVYEINPVSQYCYTLKLPMYYYQPQDAEDLAKKGTRVESFRDQDVQNSMRSVP